MGTEVVDMRALSQSDLVALAAASPYRFDPRRGRDADVLPPPKIDRAVFNESAGSRKQTFSRHRVATNLSHNLTPATASSPTAAAPTEEDSENRLIVFHLQRLFAGEDPSFPSQPQIAPQPQPRTLIPPAIAAPITPAPALPTPPPSNADLEVMNPKGLVVDLTRLAELVDPYEEEMRRQTAGLGAESELLGFMNGLEGQWGSRRRRRKFVDASMFGDHLPRGWKLLLGLKRKERVAWINCRRYVSPSGHQFASCKEVSSYLMSLLGYVEAKPTAIQSSNAGAHELNTVNSVGHCQPNSTEEKQSAPPVTSVPFASHYGDPQIQLDKNETQVETNGKECQKCNLTFQDQSAYVQHQLTFHQRKAKRRKVNKSGEVVVKKNGTFVTQECQKTSEDKLGHIDHNVAAAKNQSQTPEKLPDKTISGELGGQPSMAPVPVGFQEMDGLTEQGKESSAGKLSRHCNDPLHNMAGVPEQEKGSAEEPVTAHHEDSIDNFDNHKVHDGACHNAEEPHAVEAASKFSTGNSANFQEIDSTDLVLSSADCTQSVNKTEKTCSLPEEVPNATGAQSESKCTDDPMDCTDTKPFKKISEPCDLLDDKFSSFPEGSSFNGQEENSPLSSTLNEPDLNSIDMEVDNDNVECKYGNADDSTSPENGKHIENQIVDCRMTALKDHEINTDVRIRDVNLNSCLDTMSSPVSGANYETSNAPDDNNRSSIIAQCFGASSADDNACKEENFVNNQNNASKAESFVNQNNDMMYQPNLTMDPISPAQINVDCFTSSCSMTSEIKNNSNRREDNAKEQLMNPRNITSNEAGFDVEAYSNIFNGAITESSLAQLNNAINMKADYSSCYSLSDLNTLTGGSATDEIDIHSMRNTFVNSSTSRNEPNEHCTLDFDIKGSMLEALEKSDSDLENQYNGSTRPCGSLPAAGTNGSIDDFMSMQTNFGSLTSLVRSVEDGPMSRIIQDQCDLQLGFGVQKPQMYPSFEEQLRMASAGAPQFGSMSRHNHVPVPEPTLMLGYAPHIGSCPPVQIGWDMSMSKMVGECVLQSSVCVWCNTQFQHFGTVADQQADSLGFICPACKEKISGHLSMLNNSSSQL
ncbi:hypothetical protein E2562_024878 [Oryza meyeriana var. granulata]|uniref:C2H2-type domain-containing protein n=1 Tax=Oryza meyeriana var. granulata TaxID=110450 RepID=A0A6G1DMS2_9ORYZ|nr:hypothetical protein E2562_024878 [Oryza meyeriana var. granulata]